MFSNETEQRMNNQTNNDKHVKIKNKTEKTNKTKKHITKDKCNNAEINIMYTNLDSLSNKLNELETYAELYKADIILITEHLSKNISSHFANVYNLDGYKSIEEISGRGVIMFYKDNIEITTHDKINEMYKPSLFVNVNLSKKL